MEPVKVAAVQAAPVLLDRDETIGKVVALAEKAAAEGARLVAFPEAFVPGYPDWVWRTRPWDAEATSLYARLFDQAVTVGSPATDVLAETARRLQIWLSVGVDERDEAGSTIYNTLLHFAGGSGGLSAGRTTCRSPVPPSTPRASTSTWHPPGTTPTCGCRPCATSPRKAGPT
jgi:nitrilase